MVLMVIVTAFFHYTNGFHGSANAMVISVATGCAGPQESPEASNSSSRFRRFLRNRVPGQRILVWRVFAARELTERIGNAVIPAILIVVASNAVWILLTVLVVALSQQPRIRRSGTQ